jgi:D-arabinose 1-dehydrogenase-like Zn-dependent alcohol dehydrogenase
MAATLPQQFTAACVAAPHAAFEIVTKSFPEIKADEVLIKVEACGICHSDLGFKNGSLKAGMNSLSGHFH